MMKWSGWGDPKTAFPIEKKPLLWPWILATLKRERDVSTPAVERSLVEIPPRSRHEAFEGAVERALGASKLSRTDDDRLLHSYGKSYPDLYLVRRGIVRRAPDLVVFPESHADVEALMRLAQEHDVVVIPFGGGTNIVGGVNPPADRRFVVSLDLSRMGRLLALDEERSTATIEAGALGPALERDLQAKGWSLGHFPDSFEYSTLGGWLATRSAGMQSDAYGKIEDMLVSVKLVTPTGTLVTKAVPASSAGPDLNRLVTGSEGVLGVITEATMRVHRVPAARDYRGVLFPSFEAGVEAIKELIRTDRPLSLLRLQDGFETQLAFHMKAPPSGVKGFVQRQVKKWLAFRGYAQPAIMIAGIEGDAARVRALRRDSKRVLDKHRGFDLGTHVGEVWQKDKFNVPYLRDFVMDRGIMCDVAETSTGWDDVVPLYRAVVGAVKAKFERDGTPGFIGCHISHTYKTGACLYFTYACSQRRGQELEQYYQFKRLITETFVSHGAALTHHHAVGTEHRPWMEAEISKAGVSALKGVKAALDPKGLCNPGKLIPDADALAGWAQPTPPVDGARDAGHEVGAQEPARAGKQAV